MATSRDWLWTTQPRSRGRKAKPVASDVMQEVSAGHLFPAFLFAPGMLCCAVAE